MNIMEFSILHIFLFAVTLYYVFLIFNVISRRNKTITQNPHYLPPGSSGWPFVGETLDYLSTAKNGVPEKFTMDRRNKYSSNIFTTSLHGESVAFLCTPKGNKFIFSNEYKLVKAWWPRNFAKVFDISKKTTISEEASKMKKRIFPLLKPNSLRKYVGIMDKSTREHMKTYWDGKEVIKGHALAKKCAFALACKLFLNIVDPEIIAKLEDPIGDINAGANSLSINLPGTKLNRAMKSSKKIKKEIEKLVAERRIELLGNNGCGENDLVSELLVETYDNGRALMKDSDIAKLLEGFLVGAYDTISSTLVCIMSFLAELPHVYDDVFREQMKIANEKAQGELLNWEDIQNMRYSWNVVCEVLRLSPPSAGGFREALTDFMYEGFLIPKGFKLHWNVFATHKNPEYFPEPEKFEPSRFEGNGPVPYSYVPFGGGPRMCPGNEYARVKILVFLHNVVKNFKWEKVFPEEKIIRDPTVAPEKGLPIRLYRHKN